MSNTCKDCRWYSPLIKEAASGQCRRYAPLRDVKITRSYGWTAMWPVVGTMDWCGCFEKRN